MKGIIFDLGGTLLRFDARWEEVDQRGTAALSAFLRAHGIAVGDDFPPTFLAARQRGWKRADETHTEHTLKDALGETLTQLGHVWQDRLLPRAVQVYFAEGEPHWVPYPDALETVQTLYARGLRLGLISNADDDGVVHRLVQQRGLAPYLSPVLSSAAEPRWRKPDPRIFHRVSRAWQLPPREIVMVGDSPRYDILGAHRAGLRAILIDRGENQWWQQIPDELANDPAVRADATVCALAEIPRAIEEM